MALMADCYRNFNRQTAEDRRGAAVGPAHQRGVWQLAWGERGDV